MNTLNLNLPTWDEGNTEPDLVFNQLLLVSDALLKSPVQAIQNAPPSAPALGQSWIVGTAPTGAWAGHANDVALAVSDGPGWKFLDPAAGWSFWVLDPGASYRYLAGAWAATGGGGALTNPMTTAGDMIAGGPGGEPVRVAAGTEGQVLTVQPDGSVAMADPLAPLPLVPVRLSTTTAEGPLEADSGGAVHCANASAVSFTIPTNATLPLPVGFNLLVRQTGAGPVTIVAPSGVTLRNGLATAKTAGVYVGSISIHKVGTNEWYLDGTVAAS